MCVLKHIYGKRVHLPYISYSIRYLQMKYCDTLQEHISLRCALMTTDTSFLTQQTLREDKSINLISFKGYSKRYQIDKTYLMIQQLIYLHKCYAGFSRPTPFCLMNNIPHEYFIHYALTFDEF